jgi:UDP-N-acetyl-D-glucosamine dehydrogenase
MPYYVVECLADVLKKNGKSLSAGKLLVIGVTYKKDVKDLRKSPSLKLIEILQEKKVCVDYFDPIISYLDIGGIHLKSVELTKKQVSQYDCVVIATDHTRVDYDLIRKYARLVYDTRNVYQGHKDKKIIKI